MALSKSSAASPGLAAGRSHHVSLTHRCGTAGTGRIWQQRRGFAVMTCAAAQQTSYAVSINPQQQQPSAVLRHQEPEPLTLMLGVCLAFWGVSVTVSAGIGVLMKLAGRPLAYAASSRGGGSWTSTSVVDSDIMPLFLTYEDEQQPAVSRVPRDGGAGTAYRPWTGPDSYIPVSMVKVFEPGMLEAGRVARPSMLTPDSVSTLSIVSITRPDDDSLASKLPTNDNGGSNGSSNASSRSRKPEQDGDE